MSRMKCFPWNTDVYLLQNTFRVWRILVMVRTTQCCVDTWQDEGGRETLWCSSQMDDQPSASLTWRVYFLTYWNAHHQVICPWTWKRTPFYLKCQQSCSHHCLCPSPKKMKTNLLRWSAPLPVGLLVSLSLRRQGQQRPHPMCVFIRLPAQQ